MEYSSDEELEVENFDTEVTIKSKKTLNLQKIAKLEKTKTWAY